MYIYFVQHSNLRYLKYLICRLIICLNFIIKTSISPKNATNKNITWSSSDKTIARVSNKDTITGVNQGFCKITGVTKDGSNKKVSFYVRVYSEKEFIYSGSWGYNDGGISYSLRLSSTGEYTKYEHSDVDISDDEPSESGFYTLDPINKTITMTLYNGNDEKVWHYTIESRSKLTLSDGTTQITYTRDYRRKGITCTSKGLLYYPSGTMGAYTFIIIGYKGTDTTITIPSTINKREVTWLSGMNGNTDIEQVIIPDSVTFIEGGFENCTSLETVQLPADLKAISKRTFKGCTSLKSIKLPEKVVSVDSEAFCNCTNLESLYFPKGINEIEPDILKGCNQVVIYGYKNTCAEDFAKKNNLTFIER